MDHMERESNIPLPNLTYMVLSSNFELEPLFKSYVETYPDGDLASYTVVYKTESVYTATPYSYIFVIDVKESTQPFWGYLQAWCKVNRGKWITGTSYLKFPTYGEIQGMVRHTAGQLN